MIRDELALPVAEGMRARSPHPESQFSGDPRNGLAQDGDVLAGLFDIPADIRAHFYDGLVHFRLDLVPDHFLSFRYDLLFMAFKFPGLRIHHHVLLFHADGEIVIIDLCHSDMIYCAKISSTSIPNPGTVTAVSRSPPVYTFAAPNFPS